MAWPSLLLLVRVVAADDSAFSPPFGVTPPKIVDRDYCSPAILPLSKAVGAATT